MNLTEFNGQYYQWGNRIEFTPEIPNSSKSYWIMSHDLKEAFECRSVKNDRESPRPFVRVCCDLCHQLSSRIRCGYFNWPWTGDIEINGAGRHTVNGMLFKKALCSLETYYCPTCYFQTMRQNIDSWECEKTNRFINKFKKEIQNGPNNKTAKIKNYNDRAIA